MDADTARIDYTPGERMRGYDGDHEMDACVAFMQRYGQAPERVWTDDAGIVHVGPEPR